jgi:hypothetical protein
VLSTIDRAKGGDGSAWETESGQQYLTALARIAQQTVVQSNAANRPLWLNDRNPVLKLFGQFKSFASAYREGPLAYISSETIQQFTGGNQTEALRQAARIAPIVLGMGVMAGLSDWLRYDFYYNMGDPEQREIWREMQPNLDFAESVEATREGHWGLAMEEISGLPQIIERAGLTGTATFGTYFPLTAVRNYNASLAAQMFGPTGSVLFEDIATPVAKGNWSQLYDTSLRLLPFGQAMQYREQYKQWIDENLDPRSLEVPEADTTEGTRQ